METVSSKAMDECVQAERLVVAGNCPHIRRDEDEDVGGWSEYACVHPSRGDPKAKGHYELCELMWTGKCDLDVIPIAAEETGDEA